MQKIPAILLLLCFSLSFSGAKAQEEILTLTPRNYICYRTSNPLRIDGSLDEADWTKAAWTDYFIDIEGVGKAKPRYSTRAKMLWDDTFLYIAAELEEPDVWATLTERESIIFYDPDFEVFIDPDGDTHEYLEYEMNAFNTQWDLLLLKPYRDDLIRNVALDHWNYNGVQSGVYVNGTINDPSDTDRGWTLEIAFPLDAISEVSTTGKIPVNGEQYRINFSRVEWDVYKKEGAYKKKTRVVDGVEKPLPEDNWVWSPQGVVAMHQPETWGFVQFSGIIAGQGQESFRDDPDQAILNGLRLLYYRQNEHLEKKGAYSVSLQELGLGGLQINGRLFEPVILNTFGGYEAKIVTADGKRDIFIRQDGKTWKRVNSE